MFDTDTERSTVRTLVLAFLILVAALTGGAATAAADPAPAAQCQEGFCEPPTINLLPTGSAQLSQPGAEVGTGAMGDE